MREDGRKKETVVREDLRPEGGDESEFAFLSGKIYFKGKFHQNFIMFSFLFLFFSFSFLLLFLEVAPARRGDFKKTRGAGMSRGCLNFYSGLI